MAFGLKLAKVDQAEIDRKVNQAAELLELTELLDRKPASTSPAASASKSPWARPSSAAPRPS